MIEFPRTAKHPRELMLTPLIDVVFILIVFFMLTSSFMKIESLELKLPSVATRKDEFAGPAGNAARIFVRSNGELFFGALAVDREALARMVNDHVAAKTERKVVVYAAANVPMQKLVDVMDMVYRNGGKSLYVREWKPSGDAAALPVELTEPQAGP